MSCPFLSVPDVCWELVAHSSHLPTDRSNSQQFWVPASAVNEELGVPVLHPIRSLVTSGIKMQLYVESYWGAV